MLTTPTLSGYGPCHSPLPHRSQHSHDYILRWNAGLTTLTSTFFDKDLSIYLDSTSPSAVSVDDSFCQHYI